MVISLLKCYWNVTLFGLVACLICKIGTLCLAIGFNFFILWKICTLVWSKNQAFTSIWATLRKWFLLVTGMRLRNTCPGLRKWRTTDTPPRCILNSGNRSSLRLLTGELKLSNLLIYIPFILVYLVVISEMCCICDLDYRKDKPRALDILVNDLKVFSTSNEDLYKELTQLLTLENFRYIMLVFLPSSKGRFPKFSLFMSILYQVD